MDGIGNVYSFYCSSHSQFQLAQKSFQGKIYSVASFEPLHRSVCPAFDARSYVQRNCHVPLCIRFFADIRKCISRPLSSHSRFVLGLYSHEHAFKYALEYGNSHGKKTYPYAKVSKSRSVLFSVIGALIWGYGVFVFVKRDFLTYMFLKSEFVFLNYDESRILFYADCIALSWFCIFAAHYITKLLRNLREKSRHKKSS